MGSERHDARRIDNQLRGRCGRQGDPGSSRFYLSFEDDLLKKFAPPAMINLMKKFGMQNGQDIRHPMINRGIVRAQQRVEQFNFEIRKNLLEYDEVMNEQRKIVYDQRQKVLEGKDLNQLIWDMIEDRTLDALDRYLPPKISRIEWDYKGLCEWLQYKFSLEFSPQNLQEKNFTELQSEVMESIKKQYEKKTHQLGEFPMKALEKYILLEAIDSKWKDHLYAMDELKSGIGLQAFGQKDPKIEYKKAGYDLFDQMIVAVKEQVTDYLFKIVIEQRDIDALEQRWQASNFSHQELGNYSAVDRESWEQAQKSVSETSVKTIHRKQSKVGRNDPCPCGSGKKYKKCCGKNSD